VISTRAWAQKKVETGIRGSKSSGNACYLELLVYLVIAEKSSNGLRSKVDFTKKLGESL
jgi:hypothetical protein